MFQKMVRRFTHRIWNLEIARLLCKAQQENTIDSRQLHSLAAMFDPTQAHQVRR